ncbi:LysR family transcriptional regulator [Pseudomonas sessilinigenes]|uniref:LysR family transcriptional regulator n=1 Tax=Pseudomonas sessilinigenes TaxID=658629 RepID=A0ABX8MQS5_9PSED|nr:LysR family transcriptional regulator [Pseudomonas sessilinigenes]AZC26122.1 putative transcriptional regulator [Pseudomonas sessilinigenes]QXH39850.1 LysR family transcriptional regulator [Pseudomonas sessilinigenes]
MPAEIPQVDMQSIDALSAQCFLISARCASFKQAARSLNISAAALRKKLLVLEQLIGTPLFLYQDNKLSLTLIGKRLQKNLSRRQEQSLPAKVDSTCQAGVVIAVADILLRDILARDLIAFLRRNATSRIELIPLHGTPSAKADILLWLADPGSPRPDPGFATTLPICLAPIQYSAHVAKRYVPKSALPRRPEQLDDYMLVQLSSHYCVPALEPWNRLIRRRASGIAQTGDPHLALELIRNSACVGLLPDYIAQVDKALIALPQLFDSPLQQYAWLCTHAHAAARPEVRVLVELIQQAFTKRREWFTPADA